jgi:hypothetical protein
MKKTIDVQTLLIGALLGATVMATIAATTNSKTSTEVLRVRKLIVVDEKGAERIVIAAPLPDAQVLGKRLPRRSAANGIQINDTAGNERGGIVMLDDGSFIVGIDDEQCRERAHMYYIPKKGSGIYLQDGKERASISLAIPNQGEHSEKPQINLTDDAGKSVATLPVAGTSQSQ